MSCPAGQERVNGSCFQITDTICPVGYSWNDSETRCRDNNETDDGNGDGNGNGDGGGNSVSSILTFSDTTLTVEEGCDATYTVALKSKPSGDVTVTIGDPSNTDVTAVPATLTFTPDDWDIPQTVTVTCNEDDDAVDDEATVTHTVTGPGLDSVVGQEVDVDVVDNDEAGVTLSATSLTVDEVCNETYTVKLDSKPTGDVTVTIGDPSNTAVTADPPTLTFTPDNWYVPQTVTVTCTEDDNAVEDKTIVTHTVGGGDYEGVTAPDLTLTVTDNDATATQQNLGGLSDIDSTATTLVNVTATLDSIYTTFTAGDNVWHLLRGSTSIGVEAYWWQDSGSESGDTQILPTEIAGFETICLTVTLDATKLTYAIDQDVALPAEPENAESGVWKLRFKVEWGAVEAGLCNAASPVVPPSIVPALNAVYPWEE